MSNCLSLISCDGSCPNIHNISGSSATLLTPFIDNLVRINGDVDCTYYVREVRFVGFTIDSTDFLCGNNRRLNLIDFPFIRYRVNSLIYNGTQYIQGRFGYDLVANTFQCLFCEGTTAFCRDGLFTSPNNSNAHSIQLNTILDSLNLDLQTFPFGTSGGTAFRIFNDDTLEFELERLGTYNPGIYRLVWNGTNLSVTFSNSTTTNPSPTLSTIIPSINNTGSTCTINNNNPIVTSVSGVSSCFQPSTPLGYVPVTDCDVLTIFPLTARCVITNSLGVFGATRTATIVASGGTPPYSYVWDNGNRTESITNLVAGTYGVTIRDYFEDFQVRTFCRVSGTNCNQFQINPNLSYTCQLFASTVNGSGNLVINPTGGVPPYTFSGTANGSLTGITNGLLVSHADVIEVIVTDTNGCKSSVSSIIVNCPPSALPPLPLDCNPTLCLGNQYSFGFTAKTQNNGMVADPKYGYTFTSRLIPLTSSPRLRTGSYKISSINFPNSFLVRTIPLSLPISLTSTQYFNGASGAPNVAINDFLEFGFNEVTPTTPTNSNSPWIVFYYPYEEKLSTYVLGNNWIPGTTSIQISVALYDDNFCVYKGSFSLTLPTVNNQSSNFIIL